MLRRSFFYRVLAGVASLFGVRLSDNEVVGGAQVEIGNPQPMTVYARFVKRGGPDRHRGFFHGRPDGPQYVEWSQKVSAQTPGEAIEVSDYGLMYDAIVGPNRSVGLADSLVLRGHRTLNQMRSLL